MGYRELRPAPEAQRCFDDFLERLDRALGDPEGDPNLACKALLEEIYFIDPSAVSEVLIQTFDPRNITLEPEYYEEVDPKKYYDRKPWIWFWILFDRSPLGMNCYLGFEVRQRLARRIFKSCGQRVKIFHGVEFTFGYNLSVGDNVILHKYVFIDDRGEVVIHDGTSLSDFVNVYSHSHHMEDIQRVALGRTELGPRARLTYHSTVLSGVRMEENSLLGAMALATRDIPAHHVNVGIPAKTVVVKEPGKQSSKETTRLP
ncbi:MAG: acyltransferase [Acidobacteria bacterium]|nr:acyltransferase [Acidobacteriota bacterium]